MRKSLQLCLLALLTSCGDEPTRDIFAVEGIVRGQVTHENAPVSGAWVALDGLYPLHNGATSSVYDSVRTDIAGHYLGRLTELNLPDTIVTFAIRVWPPPGSGLAPAETTGLELRVTEEPARDTLTMNVALSP
jgi:hypothetical protein